MSDSPSDSDKPEVKVGADKRDKPTDNSLNNPLRIRLRTGNPDENGTRSRSDSGGVRSDSELDSPLRVNLRRAQNQDSDAKSKSNTSRLSGDKNPNPPGHKNARTGERPDSDEHKGDKSPLRVRNDGKRWYYLKNSLKLPDSSKTRERDSKSGADDKEATRASDNRLRPKPPRETKPKTDPKSNHKSGKDSAPESGKEKLERMDSRQPSSNGESDRLLPGKLKSNETTAKPGSTPEIKRLADSLPEKRSKDGEPLSARAGDRDPAQHIHVNEDEICVLPPEELVRMHGIDYVIRNNLITDKKELSRLIRQELKPRIPSEIKHEVTIRPRTLEDDLRAVVDPFTPEEKKKMSFWEVYEATATYNHELREWAKQAIKDRDELYNVPAADKNRQIYNLPGFIQELQKLEGPFGIIYIRTDQQTRERYVGQTINYQDFLARMRSENQSLGTQHIFEILHRRVPPEKLDIFEEHYIRQLGGPRIFGGQLANGRYQMSNERYRAQGGSLPRPTPNRRPPARPTVRPGVRVNLLPRRGGK